MFEFVVHGIPRTNQTKRAVSKIDWKQKVATKAKERMMEQQPTYVYDGCSATIIYYYLGSTELDVDGISKLILDSLKQIVYDDDSVVEQIVVRKTNQIGLQITNPPAVLAEGLLASENLVYVRIDAAPNHAELPK
jgi:crossover junction endodeoxyribonuclease RusA